MPQQQPYHLVLAGAEHRDARERNIGVSRDGLSDGQISMQGKDHRPGRHDIRNSQFCEPEQALHHAGLVLVDHALPDVGHGQFL